MKRQVFLSGMYCSERVARTFKTIKKKCRPRSRRTDENFEQVRNLMHTNNQPSSLCGNI